MQRLKWGEPAPLFVAPTSSRNEFTFGSAAGRYLVLCFVDSSRSPVGQAVDAAVRQGRRLFNDVHCAFFGVTADPADRAEVRVKDDIPGIRWFYDSDARVARLYDMVNDRGTPQPGWLLIDPMLRILAGGVPGTIPRMIELVAQLPPPDRHAGFELQAPVLMLPRLFEPGLCKALIEHYQRQGGEQSGFMVERDGKTTVATDPSHKRRSDCNIDDEDLRLACQRRIKARLVPEIAKAFQFHVTRMERYIVACYRSDQGGLFRPHRDNTTKGTAHRRFAVTVNLNADEYEGGELRFPEFGSRTYRPPTGGAVVFSCSLLHEALPVTRGERYAFLPFLYDDAAAAQREANNRHLDTSVGVYRPG